MNLPNMTDLWRLRDALHKAVDAFIDSIERSEPRKPTPAAGTPKGPAK